METIKAVPYMSSLSVKRKYFSWRQECVGVGSFIFQSILVNNVRCLTDIDSSPYCEGDISFVLRVLFYFICDETNINRNPILIFDQYVIVMC